MSTVQQVKLRFTNVRITFPKVFKGQEEAFNNIGDPYFSSSFLIRPDHNPAEVAAYTAAVQAAAFAKWGAGATAKLEVAKAKDKLPIHDGDLKAHLPYGAAYKGMKYLSARNNAKTQIAPAIYDNVIDPATGLARVILSANDPKAPYSGCYVNVIYSVFAYSAGGGEGIGAGLLGIQFAADGERLAGGGVAAADDFEAIPGTAAAGAPSTAAPASAASLF